MNWASKYRPNKLEQIIGQSVVVQQIKNWVINKNFPQTIAITGVLGIGKTSLARIIAGFNVGGIVDIEEKNAANERGIDDIRKLLETLNLLPLTGRCRIKIIDEAHLLTGNAASALLKTCEEPPKHVMFILCTSMPEKMPSGLFASGRCVVLNLQLLSQKDIIKLLLRIANAEKIWQPPIKYKSLYEAIAANSNGVPRVAVSMLQGAAAALGDSEPNSENIKNVMISAHKAVPELSANKMAVQLLQSIYSHDLKNIITIIQHSNGQTPDYLLQRILFYNQKLLFHNFSSGIDDTALRKIMENLSIDINDVVRVQNNLLDIYREEKEYLLDANLLLNARLMRMAIK